MKRNYAIFDAEGCCVGEWSGDWHYVFIYDSYRSAKENAVKLGVTGFQIGTAENAMTAKPSQYSR